MTFNFTVKEFILGNGTPPIQFYRRGFNLQGNGTSPSWQDIILSGNTALTLTNALANSINYLKLFGGTEQRNLPSGFTQLEYIESDGTQYIDTGITDITNSEFEVVTQQTSITGAFPTIMGALDSDSNYKVICGLSTSNNTFYSQCGGAMGYIVSSVPNDTQKHTFKVTTTINQQTLQVDDTAVVIGNYAITSTTGYPLTICARNKDTVSNFTNQKVFSVRIKKSGTLVRNLIPARRNSDSVLGMYDTVTGNFLTNAGTGTFTAGADVVPTPDAPMDIVCNNGVVKAFKTLNISTYDTSASDAGIDITFDGATDRRKWDTLNDGGTGTRHYENGFVSIYMSLNGNTYYAKALANGVVYDGSVYNTGEQIYSWNYNIDKNIDIYCPAINTDGTTETVEVHGNNLFNENDVILGYFYDDSGSYEVNINTFTSGKIPMNAGTAVTFSRGLAVNNVYMRIHAFDSNDNWIDLVAKSPNTNSLMCEGTTPANTSYIRVCGAKQSGSDEIDHECQVETGSTATTYEPYYNGGTATAENLFKVGDYKDVQEVLAGNITRNIGIKVLDGTEGWVLNDPNIYCFGSDDIYLFENPTAPISTHFLGVALENVNMPNNSIKLHKSSYFPSQGVVFIKNIAVGNVTNFKQWLANQYNAGTPVIVIYPLATATTETVTGQPLTTQAGTNIVEITQSAIDNLGLEVSYKATI